MAPHLLAVDYIPLANRIALPLVFYHIHSLGAWDGEVHL